MKWWGVTATHHFEHRTLMPLLEHKPVDALTFILEGVPEGDDRRVLDIGCGSGGLATALRKAGMQWLGLEPDQVAAEACAKAGHLIMRGDARDLPFPDASFEAAIFLNSLHHVPIDLMDAALTESSHVAQKVIIVEPQAFGDLFEALKPIDDETEVRLAAQAAIDRFCQLGGILNRTEKWMRIEKFADLESMLRRMIAADPMRAEPAQLRRTELEKAFSSAAVPHEDGGFSLSQPMVGHIISRG